MGRKPDGTTARGEMVAFRIAESGLAAVDAARGSWSRSEYIRQAVAYAIKNDVRGPALPDWAVEDAG